MARTVRNPKIDSRSARAKLSPRREPYWTRIAKGWALGYRKTKKGGTWIARYRGQDNRHRYEALGGADDAVEANRSTILSFDQAQEKARDWFKAMDGGTADDARSGPYTVSKALDAYMAWFRTHKKSVRDTEYAIEAHIRPTLGPIEVRKLSAAKLRDWQRSLISAPPRLRTGKGRKQRYREASDDPETIRRRKATANRVLTVLKAALNHAWQEGRVASDDPWRRVRPFQEASAARVRYLTAPECKRLVNACDKEFRPLAQAALLTGCRYGELAALKVGDFSPDAGDLHVRTSKSGRARSVALTEDGQTFFEDLTAGRPKDAVMLPRKDGQAYGKSHQARPLQEACKRAKITPAVSFHILRHTYASHLAMSGIPLPVIAANLGHSDTRMAERHYAHLSPSFVAETIRAAAPTLGAISKRKVLSFDTRKAQ